jgi:glucan phosphoethanolaminetransferase (alkaline phosphatase superfamily)
MNHSNPPAPLKRLFNTLPWLHFTGACLVFLLFYIFTAIHSQLGYEISAGESPGFAWLGKHISIFMALALGYLIFVGWLQHLWMRAHFGNYVRPLKIANLIQFVSIGILTLAVYHGWNNLKSALPFILLASIFLQGYTIFWYQQFQNNSDTYRLQQKETHPLLFLILLLFLNVIIAQLDPSGQRLKDHVHLQSGLEVFLQKIIPPVFAGTTGLWFGIVTLALLALSALLQVKFEKKYSVKSISFFLPFFMVCGFYAAISLTALTYAVEWQVQKLGLKPAIFALFLLVCGCGGALCSIAYVRILDYLPRTRKQSSVGIVCVSIGAILLYPLFWLITLRPYRRSMWLLLLASICFLCGLASYLLLYGDLFNPWFTAFSYFKGILLKTITIIAAGTLITIFNALSSARPTALRGHGKIWILAAVVFFLGFLPFGILGKYPSAKSTLLQFSDLTRVESSYARELAGILKLDGWVRMGQNPGFNHHPHPWPQPWELKKTKPSLLPDNFNLMVIVVDALRGDAFHSAGYHRNLTPFLDKWAKQDAVSFRRAYSQGGGSFAAFPFMIAGRSRFNLYGPDLYRENLFLKIARAEGIQHYMVMKGFGPRSIFPPEHPVIELAISPAVNDRRTATADEVFGSAQEAIRRLPAGERFLCFLHLMDVHNDLWKKPGGIDFGNSPRDLYDNNLSYLDRAVKRFVNWMKATDIYDKTVILFTSDHGEQFWEHGASLHGHTLYEEEIRIPVILLLHHFRKRFEDIPIIVADMAPTIAELAGYEIDPPYDDPHMGISLVPLILNGDPAPYLKRDVVGRASFKRRYFLFRNWQWKFIYFAELDLLQLFDVVADPLEKKNLIEEEPRLAAELEQQLMGYLEQVEGKTYRPLLTQSSPNTDLYVRASNRWPP